MVSPRRAARDGASGRLRRRGAAAARHATPAPAARSHRQTARRAVADQCNALVADRLSPACDRRGGIVHGRRVDLHQALRLEERRRADAEQRREHLAPVRIDPRGDERAGRRVAAGELTERIEGGHADDRRVADERQALDGRDADAQAGERSGAGGDGEEIDVGDRPARCAARSARISDGSRSACVRAASPPRSSTMRSSSTIATLPPRVVVSNESTRIKSAISAYPLSAVSCRA